jgi:hypothetical protein
VTASKPPPPTARRVEIHALLVDPVARAAVEADLAAGAKVDDDGVLHYVLATARTSVFVYPKTLGWFRGANAQQHAFIVPIFNVDFLPLQGA